MLRLWRGGGGGGGGIVVRLHPEKISGRHRKRCRAAKDILLRAKTYLVEKWRERRVVGRLHGVAPEPRALVVNASAHAPLEHGAVLRRERLVVLLRKKNGRKEGGGRKNGENKMSVSLLCLERAREKKKKRRSAAGRPSRRTHFGEVLGAAVARVGGLDLVDLLPDGFAVGGHGH